jgi:leader peptidase (prepilin peptidase)/N-methyltransferase
VFGEAYDWGWAVLAVLPAYAYLAVAGAAMGFIDVALHRLPNVFTLRSYPAVAALLTAASLVVGESVRLVGLLVGLVVMGGLYLLLYVIYPAGMGFGDVKLSGVLGMALGFLSIRALFWGLTAGFLLGAVVSLVVLALQRSRDLKTNVPFGPSMLVGALLAVLLV